MQIPLKENNRRTEASLCSMEGTRTVCCEHPAAARPRKDQRESTTETCKHLCVNRKPFRPIWELKDGIRHQPNVRGE